MINTIKCILQRTYNIGNDFPLKTFENWKLLNKSVDI